MEIEIEDIKFGVKLGFGNVMKIQGLLSQNLTQKAASELANLGDVESMDEIPEEHRHAIQQNMNMMPEILKLCISSVNGKPISNPEVYVDETMHPNVGIKLFEYVINHINEMMVPKGSENKLTE